MKTDNQGTVSVEEASRELHRYASRFGFDRIAVVRRLQACQGQNPANAVGRGGLRWTPLSIISDNNIHSIAVADMPASCPIGHHCLSHDEAFAWRYTDAHFFRTPAGGDASSQKIASFMKRFRVGGAITTPRRLGAGSVGIVSWLTSDPKIDLQSLVARRGSQLRARAAEYLTRVGAAAEADADIAEPDHCLTTRELECLRWTALGKTTEEIGTLISRSSETARFHLKSAVRKLSANGRVHAVARAAYFGLLGDIS